MNSICYPIAEKLFAYAVVGVAWGLLASDVAFAQTEGRAPAQASDRFLTTLPGVEGDDGRAGGTPLGGVCDAFNPLTSCQQSGFMIAYNVSRFATAESVSALGPVLGLCVQGFYFNNTPSLDRWVITVYEDSGGQPGEVLTTFTQGIDLIVLGPAPTGAVFIGRNVQEWNFALARPVLHLGGCLWYECRNFGKGDAVFQLDGDATNGNHQAVQDLNQNGVYELPAERLENDLNLCISSVFLNNQLCFDDPCEASRPSNDDCSRAIRLEVNDTIFGSTACATADAVRTCSGASAGRGVWYSFVGTGNTMTVSLCVFAGFDTALDIYCNTCDEPLCAVGNDDFCGDQSSVTLCTRAGTTYFAYVHGAAGAIGDFAVALTDNGIGCSSPPACTACAAVACPIGAIIENEACGAHTNDGCNALPNRYQHVSCNQTICGTAYSTLVVRDTDWYTVTAPASGTVSMTLAADFNAVGFILDLGTPIPSLCGTITLLAQMTLDACETGTISAKGLVPDRTYVVLVAPAVFDIMPCSASYVLTIDQGVFCGACCDVNSDGALDTQDYFDFLIRFFENAPSADYNSDGFVDSQDFFDFLSCFFTLPGGCP